MRVNALASLVVEAVAEEVEVRTKEVEPVIGEASTPSLFRTLNGFLQVLSATILGPQRVGVPLRVGITASRTIPATTHVDPARVAALSAPPQVRGRCSRRFRVAIEK